MVLWGIERFLDEHLWLGEDGHLGSLLVQGAGIALAVVGGVLLATRLGPLRRWRRGEGGDPAPRPVGSPGTPEEDRPTARHRRRASGEAGPVSVEGEVGDPSGDPEDAGGSVFPAPVPSSVPSVSVTDDD